VVGPEREVRSGERERERERPPLPLLMLSHLNDMSIIIIATTFVAA
jgi:hypothetical protein